MDDQSDKALHLALLNGYEDVISCLRNDYGAEMSLRDARVSFAVDVALNSGLVCFIQRLVDEGQLVEDELTVDQALALKTRAKAERQRQFIMAVMAGETETVRALSDSVDVHAKYDDKLTALWHASQRGYDLVVENLLSVSNFDGFRELLVADSKGRTAMTVAVISGNVKVVRLLVHSRLHDQIAIPDKDGWVPAEHAVFQFHFSGREQSAKMIIEALFQRDGEVPEIWVAAGSITDRLHIILQTAAEIGNPSVVGRILGFLPDVRGPTNAAYSTARDRNASFLKKRRLPSEGFISVCNATDSPYPMAIYLAAVQQHEQVLSLLLSVGRQEQHGTQWFMALGLELKSAYDDATSMLIKELNLGTVVRCVD
jgi:ankyrin repeat protein